MGNGLCEIVKPQSCEAEPSVKISVYFSEVISPPPRSNSPVPKVSGGSRCLRKELTATLLLHAASSSNGHF